MEEVVFKIKNMVCPRCIKAVKSEFEDHGFQVRSIKLGEVVIDRKPNNVEYKKIEGGLNSNGFEILSDRKSRIVEQIKTLIIEMVHYNKQMDRKFNVSDFLSGEIGFEYSYLSNLFSSVEGTTIEKCLINQKIEKVKELLVYEELTLSEIAFQMGYSSTQHLSAQFKKVTGMSPSQFKKIKDKTRTPLDQVGR